MLCSIHESVARKQRTTFFFREVEHRGRTWKTWVDGISIAQSCGALSIRMRDWWRAHWLRNQKSNKEHFVPCTIHLFIWWHLRLRSYERFTSNFATGFNTSFLWAIRDTLLFQAISFRTVQQVLFNNIDLLNYDRRIFMSPGSTMQRNGKSSCVSKGKSLELEVCIPAPSSAVLGLIILKIDIELGRPKLNGQDDLILPVHGCCRFWSLKLAQKAEHCYKFEKSSEWRSCEAPRIAEIVCRQDEEGLEKRYWELLTVPVLMR